MSQSKRVASRSRWSHWLRHGHYDAGIGGFALYSYASGQGTDMRARERVLKVFFS